MTRPCPPTPRVTSSPAWSEGPEAFVEFIDGAKSHLESRRRGDGRVAADADIWERFYLACDPLIRELVEACSGPADHTDDGVQDVWALLIVRLPRFEYNPGRGPFRAWLTVFVRHALAARARSRRPPAGPLASEDSARLIGREPDPALAVDQLESGDWAHAALEEFTARASANSRQVVHLRWVEGLTVAETAARLGFTPAQVRALNHRALQKLRRILVRRLAGGKINPRIRATRRSVRAYLSFDHTSEG